MTSTTTPTNESNEDETQKAEDKVDAMELKLQGKDRQKLPPLVAERFSAYDSAEKFRTVIGGNHYLDMQIITHIHMRRLWTRSRTSRGGW